MSKMNRRQFVGTVSTTLIGGALGGSLKADTKISVAATGAAGERALKVRYIGASPTIVQEAARDLFQKFTDQNLIPGFELAPLNKQDMISRVAIGECDVLVTSFAFHSRLPWEGQFFGPLPFGLAKSEKMRWLDSESGRAAQEYFLKPFSVHPLPLAVGGEGYGFVGHSPLASVDEIKGLHMPSLDSRGYWWKALGAYVHLMSPTTAFRRMLGREVAFSETLPHAANHMLLERAAAAVPLTYLHSRRLKTAPTWHLVWNAKTWNAAGESQKTKMTDLTRDAFQSASVRFDLEDQEALERVSTLARVEALQPEIEDAFAKLAPAWRKLIASQSPRAREILHAYESFERGV